MSADKNGKWNRFKQYLLDIFFPRHVKCIFCGEELNGLGRNDVCENCLNTLPFITNFCLRCGEPMSAGADGVCLRCKQKNYDFVMARSVFEYTGKVVYAVHKYKYSGQKFLCEPMANFLCEYLARWDILPDIVTAVPMHKNKLKARGYNQARIMAEIVAARFGLPYIELVDKIKDTASQTTLSYGERQNNAKDSYAFNPTYKNEVKDKIVLLIDDVYTTGATANEIAHVLKVAQAKEVYVLTLAHTIIKQEL